MNQLEKALSVAYAELYVRMEKALAHIAQQQSTIEEQAKKLKEFEEKEQSVHEA